MSKSKIEWTDETWNPVTGCAKVSAGCEHCYAETYAHRFWGDRKFTDVQCHVDRLEQPLRWKKPRKIFVNSMSDLFHPDVPFEFVDKLFAVMALCPQHTFQILTKRPERMREYISRNTGGEKALAGHERLNELHVNTAPFFGEDLVSEDDWIDFLMGEWPLPNVWLGVSVEDQKTADARIPRLLETPASIRFVSHEPALGPADFKDHWLKIANDGQWLNVVECGRKPESQHLNWVIMGGESGSNARPMHPDWARSIRDQCQEAGVPFFFKQWGEWKFFEGRCWGPKRPMGLIYPGGKFLKTNHKHPDTDRSASPVIRIGKKRAGRLLDGKQHDEFPKMKL